MQPVEDGPGDDGHSSRLSVDRDNSQAETVPLQSRNDLVGICGPRVSMPVAGGLVDAAGQHVVEHDQAGPGSVPLDVDKVAQRVLGQVQGGSR
jgi:hypothetical protein